MTSSLGPDVSPVEETTLLYQGVGKLMLKSHNTWYVDTADVSKARTVIDTKNGSLIGLSSYGQSHVAAIGSLQILRDGLGGDPAAGGLNRAIFNLFAWLSDQPRSVGQQDDLRVLSLIDRLWPNDNQSLFWEWFEKVTDYAVADADVKSQINGSDFLKYDAAARYSEALMPDGHWSRSYGVVVLSADATESEVQLVRQWAQNGGGGVLIAFNQGLTPSAPVLDFMNEIGLVAYSGRPLDAGDYSPTFIDPTIPENFRTQVLGDGRGDLGTFAHPAWVANDIHLPKEVLGGTVTWKSLNPAVIANDGSLVGVGQATMEATLTYANGVKQTYNLFYNAYNPDVGKGVSLRLIDASAYKVNGVSPSVTDIDAWLNKDLLAQRPIYSDVVKSIAWGSTTDADPAPGKNTLWVFSGEIKPTKSGVYTFKLDGDDSARVYIQTGDGMVTTNVTWARSETQTVLLESGKAYSFWVFFKPAANVDSLNLTWRPPGEKDFSTIPTSVLAPMPEGMLSANDGLPLAYLPLDASQSGGPLSSTKILSDASFDKIYGNIAPVGQDQKYSLLEKNYYYDLGDLVLTDAVAAQAKSVSIKLDAGPNSAKTIDVINLRLDGVTNGASLAQKIAAALNTANISDAPNAITAYYDAQKRHLVINDAEGRVVSNFMLAKAPPVPPLVVTSQMSVVQAGQEAINGSPAVASVVKVRLNTSFENATRLHLSLDSIDPTKDATIIDLPRWEGNVRDAGPLLHNALLKRGLDIDVKWDATTRDLTFTDKMGRTFNDLSITNRPYYEPLIAWGDDATQGGKDANGVTTPTIIRLGTIGGKVAVDDANGDALSYKLLEGAKFGTVTLDQTTGKWIYTPSPNGDFEGNDQFTVSVSDGNGGVSDPIAITISKQKAPEVSIPMVRTLTVADPTYVEPEAHGNPLPADFKFVDVFIAQTHVERPTDPYLQLVADRYALIKVNATSLSGAPAPDFVATVTDKDGKVLGSLRLTGPDQLPKSLDLPSKTNFGVQTNDDSYVAPLPSAWIQPGITVTITAGNKQISQFKPNVGADISLTVRDASVSLYDANEAIYHGGFANWAEDAIARLPVHTLKVYDYPSIKLDRYELWVENQTGLPGSDITYGDDPSISYMVKLATEIQYANHDPGNTIGFFGSQRTFGTGLGGNNRGGGGNTIGTMWHEAFGHGLGPSHAAENIDYPYNPARLSIEGKSQGGFIGPNWGYDQNKQSYLSNYVVNPDGSIFMLTDPMAGGAGQQPPGYTLQHFSDYYTQIIYNSIVGAIEWVSDPSQSWVDGGFGGDGYYRRWDDVAKRWVVLTKDNWTFGPDTPIRADQPMYWIFNNPDLVAVRTIGNEVAPPRDILSGEGRAWDQYTRGGDAVWRVTYSTPTGLIIDNLIIPSNWSKNTINVPAKGELVRVQLVETLDASVDVYLNNKVIREYTNSEALANTVFKGDPFYTAEDANLVLPKYWNGSSVTWSTNAPGVIDLSTGKIDGVKLLANPGAAIKAQWVDDGVFHEQAFVLKMPDTVEVMHQLFGVVSEVANPTTLSIISTDRPLPTKIDGGKIVWTSSDPSVIDTSGHLLKQGLATLTATITWDNGAVQTFSQTYGALPQNARLHDTALVTYELFGLPSKDAVVTKPSLLVSGDDLPTTTDVGTVVWSSSNASVTINNGKVGGSGRTDLTAKVTFTDGTSSTYTRAFEVVSPTNLVVGGLTQRVINVADFKINGIQPSPADIDKFLVPTVLDRTPILTTITSNLTWSENKGLNSTLPGAVVNGVRTDGLWSYSGFVIAPQAGRYEFKLTADDSARLFVSDEGVSSNLGVNYVNEGTLSVDLEAGQALPIWVFIKPANSWANESFSLTWKAPGATDFTAIPGSNLAAMPTSLLPPTSGFTPAALPTQVNGVSDPNLMGLQLRIVDTSDLAGKGYNLDQYLTADVLGRTPLYSSVFSKLELLVKPKGGGDLHSVDIPGAVVTPSGGVKDTLWVFSGFLTLKVGGTYKFSIEAEDAGRFYIQTKAGVFSRDDGGGDGEKSFSVDLKAGETVPIWLFFKTQPENGFYGDWIYLKWQTPGSTAFTSIPLEQIQAMPDWAVPPSSGYPPSLLPFDTSDGIYEKTSTKVAPSSVFTTPNVANTTQLKSSGLVLTAQTTDVVAVARGEFDQTVTIPAELDLPGMKHWVKLVVVKADGTIVEQDPLEAWTITTHKEADGSTTLRVKGVIDPIADLSLASIKVYTDDNFLDAVKPAVIDFPVNQGPVGLLIRGHVADYTVVQGGIGAETLDRSTSTTPLAIRGGGGNDLIKGGAGADVIDGGAGDDTIYGGAGSDRLLLSAGKDALHGQAQGATGEANALVIVVADLDHVKWAWDAAAGGARLVSADDDVDLMITSPGTDQFTVKGVWRGDGAATTADGVQSLLVTDGAQTARVALGTGGADSLTFTGADASINRIFAYAGAGDDQIRLGVGKPVTLNGGAGVDAVTLDWAGLFADTTGKTLTLRQDVGGYSWSLEAVGANGSRTVLLGIDRNSLTANEFTVHMHLSTGTVVSHDIFEVEQLLLAPLPGFKLTLTSSGIVAVTQGANGDAANLRVDQPLTLDGGAGTDKVTFAWGENLTTSSVSLLAGYATTAPTLTKLFARTADIDLTKASLSLGGTLIAGDPTAKAILVDRSVSGQVTFWAAAFDNTNTTRAVQVRMTDTADGVGVAVLQAKYTTGNRLADGFDFNANGTVEALISADSARGYGLKTFVLADQPFAVLTQDASSWTVQSSTGRTLVKLQQTQAGQNAFALTLTKPDGSTVVETLTNEELVRFEELSGFGFDLSANAVGVRGSSYGDLIGLTSLRGTVLDAGGGLDKALLTWATGQGPSLGTGLALIRDSSANSWRITAGAQKVLDLVQQQAGSNAYQLVQWKADGSSVTHLLSNVETLDASANGGLSLGYSGDGVNTIKTSNGADSITLQTDQAVAISAGDGQDTVTYDWGTKAPTFAPDKAVSIAQNGSVWTLTSGGTTIAQLTQPKAGVNAYTLAIANAGGGTVPQSLSDVETLQFTQLPGFALGLTANGLNRIALTSGDDEARMRVDQPIILDGGAGTDKVTFAWGASVASTSVTLLANFPTMASTNVKIMAKVADLDLSTATITLGGHYVDNVNSPTKAILVDRSIAGQVTFWAAVLDGSTTKAVKVRLADTADGVSVTVLQAKYAGGDHMSDGYNFNTSGSDMTLVSRDGDYGYGLKSLSVVAPTYLTLAQDASGWTVQSSTGGTLVKLQQTQAGQNAYALTLTKPDGSTVVETLTNEELVRFEELSGFGFDLSANAVGVRGSSYGDVIGLTSLRGTVLDAGGGLDKALLTWTTGQAPSLGTGLTLIRDSSANSWRITAGAQKVLDLVQQQAGGNAYQLVQWKADGSSVTHLLSNVETLDARAIGGLWLGYSGNGVSMINASSSADSITLQTDQAVTINAGDGQDAVTYDWGTRAPTFAPDKAVSIAQNGNVWTMTSGGTTIAQLTQPKAGVNAYTLAITNGGGGTVTQSLSDVETLRFTQLPGFALGLTANGLNRFAQTSGDDEARLRVDQPLTLDGGAGTDKATFVWGANVTSTSVSLLAGFATTTPANAKIMAKVADLDLSTATMTLGGVYVGGSAKAILVDRSIAGQVTFWAAIFDGVNTKAVKVRLADTADGVSVTVLQAKYAGGDHLSDGYNFNTTGAEMTLVSRDGDYGYGLKSLSVVAPDYLTLTQDASGWKVFSSMGSSLVNLQQTQAGQNAYTLTLTKPDGSIVVETLTNEELVRFEELSGFGFDLSANAVGVRGSSNVDLIGLSSLRATPINAGDGLDTIALNWAAGSLPSLSGQALSITRNSDCDANAADWRLSMGQTKLLDVRQTIAGVNSYFVTVWKADGSSTTQTIQNAEYLQLAQLDALKGGLLADAMLTSDQHLTLRLKNSVYIATIDAIADTDGGLTATVANGGVTRDATLGLRGHADAGSNVQIYDGVKLLGQATLVGADWSYTTAKLSDGAHSFTARITDAIGNVAVTTAFTVTVQTTVPPPPPPAEDMARRPQDSKVSLAEDPLASFMAAHDHGGEALLPPQTFAPDGDNLVFDTSYDQPTGARAGDIAEADEASQTQQGFEAAESAVQYDPDAHPAPHLAFTPEAYKALALQDHFLL